MKLITAIVRPHKMDELKTELQTKGLSGLTISEVQGFGRQKGHTSMYRGAEYVVDTLPKLKCEIACDDHDVDSIVEGILSVCGTGKVGDGKIFVTNIEQVIRIRTEETGNGAL